jgi:hypothetical protein
VSQAEERVDCNIILHQRRSDQSEQQRDDVVNVVYVSGGNMSVLKGQLSCVPMCKLLTYTVRSVQLDLVRDQFAL